MSVTVYVENNHASTSRELAPGSRPDAENLQSNAEIGSIESLSGYRVVIRSNGYYQGDTAMGARSFSDVGGNRTDDRIASLRAEKLQTAKPVTVYRDHDFSGPMLQFDVGNYPDLSNYIFHDRISSYKVLPGYRLIAYRGRQYSGEFKVYEGCVSQLDLDTSNTFSSLKVVRAAPENQVVATLFTYRDGQGVCGCRQLFLGEYPDLSKIDFNEAVASININSGYRVIVYEHSNFTGPFRVYEGKVYVTAFSSVNNSTGVKTGISSGNFGPNGGRQKVVIASVKVERVSVANTVVVKAYENEGCQGFYQQLLPGGYPDLKQINYCNRIRSLEIAKGYYVEAFIDSDYAGTPVRFDKSVLSLDDLDQKISSLRIRKR